MCVSSMLPNKVLIDHAHRVSGRAAEREEDDMRYAEEDGGNHTRFILHYDELKDEVVDSLSAYLYVCVRIPLYVSDRMPVCVPRVELMCRHTSLYDTIYASLSMYVYIR